MKGTLSIWPDIDIKVNKEAEAIKNPAFRRAFMKGAFACKEGGLKAVNPYKVIYQSDGRGGTFAMAFRNYWNRGWNAWKKHVLQFSGLDHQEVKDRPTCKYEWDYEKKPKTEIKWKA